MAAENHGSSTPHLSITSLLACLFLAGRACFAATFTFANNCGYMVWPAILSNAGSAQLTPTGFPLDKGELRSLHVPVSWSGRLWGRTLCSADASAGGAFGCTTGDCGSGKVECSGGGPALPATLAEFTVGGSKGTDSYDVSLVDGYNIPMLVAPQGNCTATGCLADLNAPCPTALKVVAWSGSDGGGRSEVVGCKSACQAFGSPEYCCSGKYGDPTTCRPSAYSQFFKSACPRAYSYAYDDATSTFICRTGVDYIITFCPIRPSFGQNLATTMDDKVPAPARPSSIHRPPKALSFDFTVGRILIIIVGLLAIIPLGWRYLMQEHHVSFFNGYRSVNLQFKFGFDY